MYVDIIINVRPFFGLPLHYETDWVTSSKIVTQNILVH